MAKAIVVEDLMDLVLQGDGTYRGSCPECKVKPPSLKDLPLPTGRERYRTGSCYKCQSDFRITYGPVADGAPAPRTMKAKCTTTLGQRSVRRPSGDVGESVEKLQGMIQQATTSALEQVQSRVGRVDERIGRLEEVTEAKLRVIEKQSEERHEDSVRRASMKIDRAADELVAKVAKLKPVIVHVHTERGDVKFAAAERHEAYLDVLDAVMSTGKCMVVGPPGSGKSTLARQIAEDLGYGFTFLACTEGLSEAHILGRMNAAGDYVPSAFVQAFEGSGVYSEKAKPGMVHLWDEVDAMDANTALVINEALSNGHISIPNRAAAPFATMRSNFLQIAAANTWGTGAQVEHSGRNALDAAFLDRFAMTAIFVDYDVARERRVAEAGGIMGLAEALWKVRANVRRHGVRRPVSTRAFINAAKLRLGAPDRWSEARLLARFFIGWPLPEKAKAIEGVELAKEAA